MKYTTLLLLALATACTPSPDYEHIAEARSIERNTSLLVSIEMMNRSGQDVMLLCLIEDEADMKKQSDGRYSADLVCRHPKFTIRVSVKDAKLNKDGLSELDVVAVKLI
jgi:hypothetical protein